MKKKNISYLLGALLFGFASPATNQPVFDKTQIVQKANNSYTNIAGRATLEDLVKKEPGIKPYADYIKKSAEKYNSIYDVPPSIIVAVLKFETPNFDKYAISPAGAAGIAQFIPETAIEKFNLKAYNPKYLSEAREFSRSSLREETKAIEYLRNLDVKNAKKHMQLALDYKAKSKELFQKYKDELGAMIKNKDGSYKTDEELKDIDERFLPEKAIDAMVCYMAELLKARNGDIREAVSAYNAGLHAVERYDGIPPYDETVKYQNKIVNKIKEYENLK